MERADQIIEVLGGRRVLGRKISSFDELRTELRRGLPVRALQNVATKLGLDGEELSAALQIPPRTIARRRKEAKLPADESDRLYRLARVGAMAVRVLGSEEKAARWLHRPNRALGNESPLSLLDTAIGAREVEDLLGRIEHGVVS